MEETTIIVLILLVLYIIYVYNERRKRNYYIQSLDPIQDCEDRVFALTQLESTFLVQKSLELAIIRTFAVPRISKLLNATKQFHLYALKRFEDTDLIMRELSERKLDTERATRSIKRLNYIHGKYNIANDDMLYDQLLRC